MPKVKIGIVGSRFQADCIAASVKSMPEEAEVVAVASPTPGNDEAFARKHDPKLGRGRLVHPARRQDIGHRHDASDRQRRQDRQCVSHVCDQSGRRRTAVDSYSVTIEISGM